MVWSVINKVRRKCYKERQCHFMQLSNNNNNNNNNNSNNSNDYDSTLSDDGSSEESKDGVWGYVNVFRSYPL